VLSLKQKKGGNKMTDLKRNIERLVSDCFKEIADHSLQSEVRSIHIKNIINNLQEILKQLEYRNPQTYFKPLSRERAIKNRKDSKYTILKIAYAMSRFDYPLIQDILDKSLNQTAAFEYLSEKLDIKATTLRNYRDRFDPYVQQENSDRIGWKQAELPDEYIAVKKECDEKDYETIKKEIENILTNLIT
jgi:hypothetical protein